MSHTDLVNSPKIVLIGGGSNQWAPKLITDLVNTPSLQNAELVLLDCDPDRLPRMAAYVDHVTQLLGIGLRARTTTDQRQALEGADFVVVMITTGGFDSMTHDLEIPARHGI
ncbi:MAG: alpha-glucosidase/alpha-galactosidase, partial [Acidimicrobiales bacterium]